VLYLRDLVFSFELDESETALATWLASAAPSPDEGWTRGELEVHLRDELSTFTWLLEPMLERACLQVVDARYSDGIYAEYVCRAGVMVLLQMRRLVSRCEWTIDD